MPILVFVSTSGEPPPAGESAAIPDLTNDGIVIHQFDGNDIEYVIEDEVVESDQVDESSKAAIIAVDGNEHSWTEYLTADLLTRNPPYTQYLDSPDLTTQADVTNLALQEAFSGKDSNSPGGLCVYRPYFNRMDKVRWVDPKLGSNYEGRINSMKIEFNQSTDPFQRVEIGISPLLLCTEPATEVLLAEDNFDKDTVVSGWGTASYGGAWTAVAAVSSTAFNVNGSVASLKNDGNNFGILTSLSETEATAQVKIKVPTDKLRRDYTSGFDWGLVMRYASSTSWHAAVLRLSPGGVLKLLLMTWDTSDGKNVWARYKLPFLFGQKKSYNLKAQISGTSPTTLKAKVWQDNGLEPSNWQLEATCWETNGTNRGPQSAGSLGLMSSRITGTTGNFTAFFDDYKVIE